MHKKLGCHKRTTPVVQCIKVDAQCDKLETVELSRQYLRRMTCRLKKFSKYTVWDMVPMEVTLFWR